MGKKTIAHNTPNTNTKETRNRNLGVNRNKGEQLPTSYNNDGCSNPRYWYRSHVLHHLQLHKRQLRKLNFEIFIEIEFTTFSNPRVESEQKEENYML